jgi:hypothetical protein
MDDFYFQDATKGVVDDWVKDLEDQPTTTPQGFDNNDLRKNYGLGFDKKEEKKQGHGANSNDALVERMARQKKKKEYKLEAVEITHGIVEEEILSRVSSNSVAGKKRKQNQEEEQKKPNIAHQSTPVTNPGVVPQPQSQGILVGADEMGQDQQPPKRVKTRSKQKNIRRDKRAEEFKPSHLHIGSKEYTGRPLTKETKAILGIPPKVKPARR